INLVAKKLDLLKESARNIPVVLTPHLKEMERLTGINLNEIKYDIENVASNFAKNYNCTVILKDATTIVATKKSVSYIISGNEGLATPGSGDVLAGIVASLVGQKVNPDFGIIACAAAHLHGTAGRLVGEKSGVRSVLASYIIEEIKNLNKI
ncbi:MAG: NAD(P)H-hydrate dehydratase, partial [Pseudobutyrivibrio sp.]|nr:NAD(P)H-hydrate dehydratase [Pseudobutyrivibrio sp.]